MIKKMGGCIGRLCGFVTHEAIVAIQKSDYEALKKIITQDSFDVKGQYRKVVYVSWFLYYDYETYLYHQVSKNTSLECYDLLLSHGARICFFTYEYQDVILSLKFMTDPKQFLLMIYLEEGDVAPEGFAILQLVKIMYCFHKRNINLLFL